MIDISIIALVAAAVLSAYSAGFKSMELARAKIAAVALANEKMEEIRNMTYDSLATKAGPIYPPGDIFDDEQVERKGIAFNVHTAISYIDDPYDGNAAGTIPGKPKDLYPYDYKKAEITVSKLGRSGYLSKLSSNVAAKAAETPSNTGIIVICVVDSSSSPVPEATVTIENPDANPPVNISALTGSDGCIMVPNLPPSNQNNYHLTATKDGYSIDLTYPRTSQNPNALIPDVDVLAQDVTSQTLIIDKFSTMNVVFVDQDGAALPNQSVHIEGSKKKYFNPDTPKYAADLMTDASGRIAMNNLEFDDYVFSITGWRITAVSPYQPVNLKADTTLDVKVLATQLGSLPGISSCLPISGKIGETVNLTISGNQFQNGLSVNLINGTSEIVGSNIIVTGSDTIEADFNLTGAIEGFWDILITNPDGQSIRQEKGFEVKSL